MAKTPSKSLRRHQSSGSKAHSGFAIQIDTGAGAMVRFGSVSVSATPPSKAEVTRNIRAAQNAMTRVVETLVKPGVALRATKGVPHYHADPKDPDVLVRKLNGKIDRGVFIGSEFKVRP